MKRLLKYIFAVVCIAATSPVMAYDETHNLKDFTAHYNSLIDEGSRAGSTIRSKCYPLYCAKTMTTRYTDGGIFYLAKITANNNITLNEICYTKQVANIRRCADSTGMVWEEHNIDIDHWVITETFSTHFDN